MLASIMFQILSSSVEGKGLHMNHGTVLGSNIYAQGLYLKFDTS